MWEVVVECGQVVVRLRYRVDAHRWLDGCLRHCIVSSGMLMCGRCAGEVGECVASSATGAEHGWFAVQGWTLPVKQEDTEILDLVILRAEALQQKVNATVGSRLPLQVGLGHFGWTVGVLARRWHDRPLQCKCECGVGAPL